MFRTEIPSAHHCHYSALVDSGHLRWRGVVARFFRVDSPPDGRVCCELLCSPATALQVAWVQGVSAGAKLSLDAPPADKMMCVSSLPTCRCELPADREAIHLVETAAFGRAGEALLVDALRAGGALSFSAVAEVDDKIVGHVALSPIQIEAEHGKFEALALAPMAVLPEWQRKGIGSALLWWSLDECRQAGHKLVIVVGHPQYYPRSGFVPALPLGIRCPSEVPNNALMLLELQPGALAGHKGMVRYRPEFDSL